MTLWTAFIVLYLVAALVAAWAGCDLQRFLAATPSIADDESLTRYKALARRNMYASLLVTPLMLTGCVIGIILILRHTLTALAAVVAANLALFILSRLIARLEKAARNLPTADDSLALEHQAVSESWTKKAFPDF